jgi:hypothetical protein
LDQQLTVAVSSKFLISGTGGTPPHPDTQLPKCVRGGAVGQDYYMVYATAALTPEIEYRKIRRDKTGAEQRTLVPLSPPRLK